VANPFGLESVLLAKHAQHVVLVHFPIALTTAAIAFEWIAVWKPGPRTEALAEAAYWNLTAAAITVMATIVTGLLAWQWQLEGAPLRGTLLLHMLFGGASGVVILLLWWLRFQKRNQSLSSPGRWYLALTVAAFLIITITGHLGGYVSGVNTTGREHEAASER
jgi:uncharacterized membrane protein